MGYLDKGLHNKRPCPRADCRGSITNFRDDLGERCDLCGRSPQPQPAPLRYVAHADARVGASGVEYPAEQAG